MASVKPSYEWNFGSLGETGFDLYLMFLEPSRLIFMISGIDERVVSVWKLLMNGMIHTRHVAPWPSVPRSDTNLWSKSGAQYSSSILGFIIVNFSCNSTLVLSPAQRH